MAFLTEKTRRRSSWFVGPNFSLPSLKSSATPSEQSSFSDLKQQARLDSLAVPKAPLAGKVALSEPLFEDSYLSSEDEAAANDLQAPDSPTFSEEFDFKDGDIASDYEDEMEEGQDSLDDYGLLLAIETIKPSDVARKVSIVSCKPKEVFITTPTSPTSPTSPNYRKSSTVSPLRSSLIPTEVIPTQGMYAQQTSHFSSWYSFYDRNSFDGSDSARDSRCSSSSSISDVSKSTDATSVSATSDELNVFEAAPLPRRSNAVKRNSNNSNRLSSSFPKAYAGDAHAYSPTSPSSPSSPTETLRPATPRSISRPAAPRPSSIVVPNFSRPALTVTTISVPEIPRSSTPAPRMPTLKKKKSIADVWFRRNVT